MYTLHVETKNAGADSIHRLVPPKTGGINKRCENRSALPPHDEASPSDGSQTSAPPIIAGSPNSERKKAATNPTKIWSRRFGHKGEEKE